MKLWLISQDINNGYDTYDSAVVCAETEAKARLVHPGEFGWEYHYYWVKNPEDVSVKLIGEASADVTPGVVLASYRAG